VFYCVVRFIASSIYRESIHRRSINRRINLSQLCTCAQGQFIAELCQLKTWLKRKFFCLDIQNYMFGLLWKLLAARRHWKANCTKIYLIEMYNFWSKHENWVHLVGKKFSSPLGATGKLVLLNCRQTGSAMIWIVLDPLTGDDKKLFTTKRTRFCLSGQLKNFTFQSSLSWYSSVMNRPCAKLILRWIDPAMNRSCDESTRNESTRDESY
jgi:hypothetical protein